MLDDNLFATQKDEMDYSDVIFNIVAWKEQSCTQEAMYDASMSNGKRQHADGNGPHAWTTGIDN